MASSTALVATQPVWAALIARWRGAHIPRSAWVGIAISLLGVVILTGIDVSVDPRHLIGDVLALVGGMLAAAYVTVSESARRTVSTATLTTGLYAAAAVLLLGMCLIGGQALTGFSLQAWGYILALTLGAQLLGPHADQQGAGDDVGHGRLARDPAGDAGRHAHRRSRAAAAAARGDHPRGRC